MKPMSLRRYVILQLLIVFAAWLAGTYRETRADDSGWCIHTQYLMVCNQTAATDYVLEARQ